MKYSRVAAQINPRGFHYRSRFGLEGFKNLNTKFPDQIIRSSFFCYGIMEKPSRIRLTFESPKILSKSQLLRGLHNSWLSLNSKINTISDLAAHICRVFKLNRSCPNGILLYMEDFVLPQFESICLLKDNDIIRVKKNDIYHQLSTKDSEIRPDERAICNVNVLSIKEFGENSSEQERYDDEHLCINSKNASNLGTCSKLKKKRKRIDDIQVSKKKKSKVVIKKPTPTCDKDEETSKEDFSHPVQKGASSPEIQKKKDKEVPNPLTKEKRKKKSQSDILKKGSIYTQGTEKLATDGSGDATEKLDKSQKHLSNNDNMFEDKEKTNAIIASPHEHCVNEKIDPGSRDNRNVQVEKGIEGNMCDSRADDKAPKVLSRSSRRKKAKRKWARELKSQEEQIAAEVHGELSEPREAEQNTEVVKDIVPILIKPGHIRFRSLDEEENEDHPQTQGSMGTFQWNGTTSKKKGQKWGMEKTKGYFNDVNGYEEHTHNELFNAEENTMNESDIDYVSKSLSNGTSNGREDKSNRGTAYEIGNTAFEKTRMDAAIDFERLLSLTRTPQVGDVLAYRVIELSSSWCPEVSPFRVGLVKSYDSTSLDIVLECLPEYPITVDDYLEEEEDVTEPVLSLYDEDGSLQISYSQLIDVRLLKESGLEAPVSNNFAEDAIMQENNCLELAVANGSIASEPVSQPTFEKENEADSGWEEIRKELEKKKAELEKKSACPSAALSYRAMRKSAVGPLLAYLRNKKDEQT